MAQGDIQITVVGNLTGDPELRFTPNGDAVTNFTVASSTRRLNKQTNEWEDGETTFIRCNVWRQYAENVAESLTRGMRVIVTGRLSVRQYEKQDGTKGTSVECQVDDVGPVLRYATAKVTKAQRTEGAPRGGGVPAGGDPWANQAPRGGAPAADPWATNQDDSPPF
jgi:single-strand DNA-binding protein